MMLYYGTRFYICVGIICSWYSVARSDPCLVRRARPESTPRGQEYCSDLIGALTVPINRDRGWSLLP